MPVGEARRVRAEVLAVTAGGLRAVHRTLELPGRDPAEGRPRGSTAFGSEVQARRELAEVRPPRRGPGGLGLRPEKGPARPAPGTEPDRRRPRKAGPAGDRPRRPPDLPRPGQARNRRLHQAVSTPPFTPPAGCRRTAPCPRNRPPRRRCGGWRGSSPSSHVPAGTLRPCGR
jgi:hypothetical protein